MDPARGSSSLLDSTASLSSVLSEIAETASETLELREVFDRIATSVRLVIPFDHMGVVQIHNDVAVQHASTFDSCYLAVWEAQNPGTPPPAEAPECMKPCPLTNWSPRLRPRPGPIARVDDAKVELDPSFPGDAEILAAGARSTLWEPFRTGGVFKGGVWLSAYQPGVFDDAHQELLKPIAALLGSAVEHWRIWDTERRRRRRLDQVDTLLGTLAESLDVREVFERLSTEMKAVLPHDMMALTELDVRARTIELVALAGGDGRPAPVGRVKLTEEELARRADFEIVHDIQTEIAPDTDRQKLLAYSGLRSWLRVPVRLADGEVRGSLSFFHGEPSRYDHEDAEVARRLADRVALMLSHHRLAEEARIAAEARERAERLEATVETLARELEEREQRRVVGASPSWKETMLAVGRVAGSDTTVLVTGESGTGKEVVAKLLHQGSPRARKPFVAINCAALPEQLLESELFGHERGAFTGAVTSKVGRLEQAAGGTLFLDEIAEMSPMVQAKFLRVLEEREFQRVGGTRTLRADVRVIAATNRDLAAAIGRQAFREDLYYRLNVFQIHVAPLRRRREDILPMAEAFLQDLGRSMGKPAAGISSDAREWMLTYPWPGNVRELRNAIERAILLCDGGLITHDHLPISIADFEPPRNLAVELGARTSLPPHGVDLEDVERRYVEEALGQAKGNKSKAARLLGLTRAQLYTRLEKYGFTPAD